MFKCYGILIVLGLWSRLKIGIDGMLVIGLGNAATVRLPRV
jgi:hypothetical protein